MWAFKIERLRKLLFSSYASGSFTVPGWIFWSSKLSVPSGISWVWLLAYGIWILWRCCSFQIMESHKGKAQTYLPCFKKICPCAWLDFNYTFKRIMREFTNILFLMTNQTYKELMNPPGTRIISLHCIVV